jgi:hypothetical protein
MEYTTHTTAVRCIQVPNCDTDLPVKYKVYFVLLNARNVFDSLNLLTAGAILGEIGGKTKKWFSASGKV